MSSRARDGCARRTGASPTSGRDEQKGFRIAERIETGGVCINDMAPTYGIPEAPFGGVKDSGVGQVNGEAGLRDYCHAHPMIVDRFGGKEVQGGYPYSSKSLEGMKKFAKLLWGNRIGRWLA